MQCSSCAVKRCSSEFPAAALSEKCLLTTKTWRTSKSGCRCISENCLANFSMQVQISFRKQGDSHCHVRLLDDIIYIYITTDACNVNVLCNYNYIIVH